MGELWENLSFDSFKISSFLALVAGEKSLKICRAPSFKNSEPKKSTQKCVILKKISWFLSKSIFLGARLVIFWLFEVSVPDSKSSALVTWQSFPLSRGFLKGAVLITLEVQVQRKQQHCKLQKSQYATWYCLCMYVKAQHMRAGK